MLSRNMLKTRKAKWISSKAIASKRYKTSFNSFSLYWLNIFDDGASRADGRSERYTGWNALSKYLREYLTSWPAYVISFYGRAQIILFSIFCPRVLQHCSRPLVDCGDGFCTFGFGKKRQLPKGLDLRDDVSECGRCAALRRGLY